MKFEAYLEMIDVLGKRIYEGKKEKANCLRNLIPCIFYWRRFSIENDVNFTKHSVNLRNAKQ